MRRNVEIKARVADLAPIRRRAATLSDAPPERIEQEDTFFPCRQGRLKLRRFRDGPEPQTGELIFYRRPDAPGPTESQYVVTAVPDTAGLLAALTAAYGVRAVVRKQRELHRVGATRIHLDRVEELGEFVELEVVLEPGESVAQGVAEAERLMDQLGIPRAGLLDAAYVDLLERGEKPWN